MKSSIAIVFVAFVLPVMAGCSKRGPTEAEIAAARAADERVREELAAALAAKFSPYPAKWKAIEVNETKFGELGKVYVSLVYSRPPSGYAEAEKDTTLIVRACLRWLMDRGVDPAAQQMTVSASADIPWEGETGKTFMRRIGRSRYYGTRDKIEFLQ